MAQSCDRNEAKAQRRHSGRVLCRCFLPFEPEDRPLRVAETITDYYFCLYLHFKTISVVRFPSTVL